MGSHMTRVPCGTQIASGRKRREKYLPSGSGVHDVWRMGGAIHSHLLQSQPFSHQSIPIESLLPFQAAQPNPSFPSPMDPPPAREEQQPESRPCPDADDPEPSRSERDDPETSRSERGDPETSRSEQRDDPSPGAPLPPLRQQIMGACRADERLRPLLTLNVSCTAADDRFIAHLAQVTFKRRLSCLLRVYGFTPHLVNLLASLPRCAAALRGVGGRHARAMPVHPPRLPARWQGPEGRRPLPPNTH